ncbi:MAG: hypothetical protein MUO40_13205, partial [Anaerolineaceae bacterium]|nr:hypothetical protein [Anaerolineaceae bacterium]
MKRTLPIFIIFLIIIACTPQGINTPTPSILPENVLSQTTIDLPPSEPSPDIKVTKFNVVEKYILEIPKDYTVIEILSSSSTSVPIYRVNSSSGASFDITVHPYSV